MIKYNCEHCKEYWKDIIRYIWKGKDKDMPALYLFCPNCQLKRDEEVYHD